MSQEPLIQIENLHYRYQTSDHDTLFIPEFKVQKGERVFLYGPSGSGKTTLLEIMAGILKVQRGLIKIAHKNLSAMTDSERDEFRAQHLGYIFQSFNLIPYLSVQENIELPVHLKKHQPAQVKRELEHTVRHLCQRLGIEHLLSKNVTELSVGQQQRVAVARALCGKPDLILADEPTSSLDADHRQRFLELLFELGAQSNTTVLFVSHDRSIEPLFSRAVSLASINKVEIAKGLQL